MARKTREQKCGCGTAAKPSKVKTKDGWNWIMCRVNKGSRTRKPGTFSKRATCN